MPHPPADQDRALDQGQDRDAGSPAPGPRPDAPRPTWSDRLPEPWLLPLLTFAASWVLIIATWYASDALYHQSEPWTYHFLFKDANWYMMIARQGYPVHFSLRHPPSQPAFFPLFPALIRASALVFRSWVIGGLIATILTGAASSLMVWLLAARVRGRWVADRAVLLYCLFPGAMTFGMMYSEPLTIAIVAAMLLALVSRHWLAAGVIGAFATAQASVLVVMAVVAGAAALQAIWQRREWIALVAPALTPLGVLAYFSYLGHRYHDYDFWFQTEKADWSEHWDWGRQTLHLVLWNAVGSHLYPVYCAMSVILLGVVLTGIGLMLADRLPLPMCVYTILLVSTFVLSPANPRPRYVSCAVPLFIAAAAKLPKWLYWPVLVLSAAGLAFVVGWWPHHYVGPAP